MSSFAVARTRKSIADFVAELGSAIDNLTLEVVPSEDSLRKLGGQILCAYVTCFRPSRPELEPRCQNVSSHIFDAVGRLVVPLAPNFAEAKKLLVLARDSLLAMETPAAQSPESPLAA